MSFAVAVALRHLSGVSRRMGMTTYLVTDTAAATAVRERKRASLASQNLRTASIQLGYQSQAGAYTLDDILAELRKPGRDPRSKFVAPVFRAEVREISDVQSGMVLEGAVTNVTKFGAFVDIGVHQDGLVHISELSSRYIKEPSEAVKAGQIVKVKVLSVDTRAKRIALSIKALAEPSSRPVPNSGKSAPMLQPTRDEKFAAFLEKWNAQRTKT